MQSILHLTLTAHWFDQIVSGAKTEEYRVIKPHWNRILSKRKYDVIQFVNGYGKHRPRMVVELKGINTGLGIIEWGAPPKESVYILRLGKVLEVSNYPMH